MQLVVRPFSLGRPNGSSGGFFLSMMFFLSPRVLQGPSADRRETLPVDGKVAEFYNAIPKIAPPPRKKWGPKQAEFRSIFCNV